MPGAPVRCLVGIVAVGLLLPVQQVRRNGFDQNASAFLRRIGLGNVGFGNDRFVRGGVNIGSVADASLPVVRMRCSVTCAS